MTLPVPMPRPSRPRLAWPVLGFPIHASPRRALLNLAKPDLAMQGHCNIPTPSLAMPRPATPCHSEPSRTGPRIQRAGLAPAYALCRWGTAHALPDPTSPHLAAPHLARPDPPRPDLAAFIRAAFRL